MSAVTSIVVNDRATTPVAHTFTPRDVNNEPKLFVESTGVMIGERKFTVSRRETATGIKVRLKLENPVVVTETINGVNDYAVPRTAFGDVTFTFSKKSTPQERKDTVGMLYNALAASQTMLNATLVDNEAIY